jgi:hypothetical protein
MSKGQGGSKIIFCGIAAPCDVAMQGFVFYLFPSPFFHSSCFCQAWASIMYMTIWHNTLIADAYLLLQYTCSKLVAQATLSIYLYFISFHSILSPFKFPFVIYWSLPKRNHRTSKQSFLPSKCSSLDTHTVKTGFVQPQQPTVSCHASGCITTVCMSVGRTKLRESCQNLVDYRFLWTGGMH